MSVDARGWRIALVADSLLNPPAGASFPDVLGILNRVGYGLLQLPASGEYRMLLAATADQVTEFARHGYAIVAIGIKGPRGADLHWQQLSQLLRHRGMRPPPRHLVDAGSDPKGEEDRLADWLSNYDLPAEERQRWRR